MYRMPNPLTLDALRELMKDRRYQDKSHPEYGSYVKFITDGFRQLYPEPGKGYTRVGLVTAEPDTILSGAPRTQVAQQFRGASASAANEWPDPIGASEPDPGHNRPRWPGSPANRVDPNYRDKLSRFESRPPPEGEEYPRVDPYPKVNREGGSMGALGKYQVRKGVLQDAGIADKDGNWTGKPYSGVPVDSERAFLGNDRAQEEVLAGLVANNERSMKNLGILGKDGAPSAKYKDRTIETPKGDAQISEAGLQAAAHYAGVGGLRYYYLQQVERNGWRSGPGIVPKEEKIMGKDTDPEEWRKEIEKRFRSFKASDRVWL